MHLQCSLTCCTIENCLYCGGVACQGETRHLAYIEEIRHGVEVPKMHGSWIGILLACQQVQSFQFCQNLSLDLLMLAYEKPTTTMALEVVQTPG